MKPKTVVVKLGGSALALGANTIPILAAELARLIEAGFAPVLVHGGGNQINAKLQALGIEPKFAHGQRVTDELTLEVVIASLNEVNLAIVEQLQAQGLNAVSVLPEHHVLFAQKAAPVHTADGSIDLGWVGRITEVCTEALATATEAAAGATASRRHSNIPLPVVAPVGSGSDQECQYNINADHAAMALAAALHAHALVFLSDVPGVLLAPEDAQSRVSQLSSNAVEELIQTGVASGGMVPKLQNSIKALKRGVRRVCITDGRTKGSLLGVLKEPSRFGTTITLSCA